MIASLAIQAANSVYSIGFFGAVGVGAGSALVGAGINALRGESEQEKALRSAMEERRKFTKRLDAISRGDFAAGGIESAVNTQLDPRLSDVSANAAARGVTGPAQAQLVANADRQARANIQLGALNAMSGSLGAEAATAQALPGEDFDVYGTIGSIVQNATLLQGLKALTPEQQALVDASTDFVFQGFGGSNVETLDNPNPRFFAAGPRG